MVRRLRPAILGITIYSIARGFSMSAFSVLFPLYILSIGYRTQDLGPMATVSSAVVAALLPLIGYLVDLGFARAFGALSGVMLALALIIPSITHSYPALILSYTLAIMSMMTWQPARGSVTAAEVGREALGRAFTGFSAAFTLARAVSPVLAVALAHLTSYSEAMALFSTASLAGASAFYALTSSSRVAGGRHGLMINGSGRALRAAYLRTLKLLKSSPGLVAYAVMDRFGWMMWMPMLNAFLKSACGLGDEGVGFFNSLFAASMLATFYPIGRLTDRIGPVKALIASEACGAIASGFLAIAYLGSWAAAYAACILMGASVEFWIAGFNVAAATLKGPESVGSVRASLDSTRTLASIPAPVIGSTLYSLIGPITPFIAGSALIAASITPLKHLLRSWSG